MRTSHILALSFAFTIVAACGSDSSSDGGDGVTPNNDAGSVEGTTGDGSVASD